jgi:hypothetical protein
MLQDQLFQPHRVQLVLRSLLAERLRDKQYDPEQSEQLIKELSDDIRDRVKAMGYDRYKLIVQVACGEKKGQGMQVLAKCIWNPETDGCASETFQNDHLFCTCQVSLEESMCDFN